MEKIKVSDNLELSRIIQGFWRVTHWNKSDKELLELMEKSLELGIDTFDTADIYMSEEAQGKAMALNPSLRDKIKIVTKCGIKNYAPIFGDNKTLQYDSSKKHIIESVDGSLKRLGTDYVDLLLIHRPDFIMNPEEMSKAFNELKSSGKVLNFGVSNFSPSQFDMLQSYCDVKLVTNQVEISPLKLDAYKDGTLDNCLKNRVNPMAWSPLAGGRIFTQNDEKSIRVREVLEKIKDEIGANSIDEVAYAWLLIHPAKIMPIVGSSNIQRLETAANALKLQFTSEHFYQIWQASLGKNID